MRLSKSTITTKGQTTIPAEVRQALHLNPGDSLLYEVGDDRVVVIPIRGTILDAAGTLPPVADFAEVREQTKAKVARRSVQR